VGRAPDLARSEGVGGGVGGARVSKALDRAAARPSRAGPINAPIAMSISLRATRSSGSTPFVISILQQGFNARGVESRRVAAAALQ
jgi:hypothetical protein